jgi:hypothetical protein
MSDERFRGFDILHEALKDEHFRRRLAEADKLAETNELELLYEEQSLYPAGWPLHIRTDGEEMTIPDQQRQTVREAIKKSAFHDQEMQDFAGAPSFELGDVLNRAKKLASDPDQPDTSVAADIVALIRGFKV